MSELRLIKAIFNVKNKALIAIMLIIAVVMASILSISLTTNYFLVETHQAKERVYGRFTDIIYATTQSEKDRNLEQFNQYGVIEGLTYLDEQYHIKIGNFNEKAFDLGGG